MKIIGKTDRGYIIEASNNDIANLTGYYSEYSYEREKNQAPPKVGDIIAVHEMYKRLYTLARRRGEIKTAQKMLRDAASELELADPIIAATAEDVPSA